MKKPLKDLNIYLRICPPYPHSLICFMGFGRARFFSNWDSKTKHLKRKIYGIELNNLQIFPEELLQKNVWLSYCRNGKGEESWLGNYIPQDRFDNFPGFYKKISYKELIAEIVKFRFRTQDEV